MKIKYEYDVVYGWQNAAEAIKNGWKITMLSGFDCFHIERKIAKTLIH